MKTHEVKPTVRRGWKTAMSLPGLAVMYQGEWSQMHLDMLRKMIEYFDYLAVEHRSDNTDDEFGWWRDEYRVDRL